MCADRSGVEVSQTGSAELPERAGHFMKHILGLLLGIGRSLDAQPDVTLEE